MDDHTSDPTVRPPPSDQNPTGWNADHNQWTHETLRKTTIHGVSLFNSQAYHEAHDCFEAEWYNYGAGTTESAYLHGMVQVAAGTHKLIDFDSQTGMQSLFKTALTYLYGVPSDFYGIDLTEIRMTLANAIETPECVKEWRIILDGDQPRATQSDYAYVKALE